MKRRRVLVILTVALMAAAVAAVVLWPEEKPEPEYQGRKLSEWIGTLRPMPGALATLPPSVTIMFIDLGGRSENEVTFAVHQMGTNATRRLLVWLAYEPAGMTRNLRKSCKLAPAFVRNPIIQWLDRRESRAAAAYAALLRMAPRDFPMGKLLWIAERTNSISGIRAADLIENFKMNQDHLM